MQKGITMRIQQRQINDEIKKYTNVDICQLDIVAEVVVDNG